MDLGAYDSDEEEEPKEELVGVKRKVGYEKLSKLMSRSLPSSAKDDLNEAPLKKQALLAAGARQGEKSILGSLPAPQRAEHQVSFGEEWGSSTGRLAVPKVNRLSDSDVAVPKPEILNPDEDDESDVDEDNLFAPSAAKEPSPEALDALQNVAEAGPAMPDNWADAMREAALPEASASSSADLPETGGIVLSRQEKRELMTTRMGEVDVQAMKDPEWYEKLQRKKDETKVEVKNLAPCKFWSVEARSIVADIAPSKSQKSKHQINWLAHDYQANAQELAERNAEGRANKSQSLRKYGW